MSIFKREIYSLVLEDGSIFSGYGFGADRTISGEVVFSTGMTGYPESFTDPSYEGQILVSTYPLIGNYGVPEKLTIGSGMDTSNSVKAVEMASGNKNAQEILQNPFESSKIHIQGLIVSNYSRNSHHWNSKKTLSSWLIENGVPAISGIDTRALTKKLRVQGSMIGKIVKGKPKDVRKILSAGLEDPNQRNLVLEVSCEKPEIYEPKKIKHTVVLYDCGAKNNIIRSLLLRNTKVIKVPWNYELFNNESKIGKYDGVIFSNGPGDPQMATATIDIAKELINRHTPTFGICLGNQILSLAAGAKTYKLKFGHRGHNQPCVESGTRRCYITSQNHGFAVNTNSLSSHWEPWFTNANDHTNEGIRHKKYPFFSVQFHPEAMPGPTDTSFLFDRFLEVLK